VDGDARLSAIHVVNLAHNLVHNQVVHHAHRSVIPVLQHRVASQDAQHTHQIAPHSLAVRHALRSVRPRAHLVVPNWCVERLEVEMYSGSEEKTLWT